MDAIEVEDSYKIIVIERDNLRFYVGFDVEQCEYFTTCNIECAQRYDSDFWKDGDLLDIGQSVSDKHGIYRDIIRIAKIKVTYKEE